MIFHSSFPGPRLPFWTSLTPFLTTLALAPRRPHDREPKYREPKMDSYYLRVGFFQRRLPCAVLLYGPLQLQVWAPSLLPASPLPTGPRKSAIHFLARTSFHSLSPLKYHLSPSRFWFHFQNLFLALQKATTSCEFSRAACSAENGVFIVDVRHIAKYALQRILHDSSEFIFMGTIT